MGIVVGMTRPMIWATLSLCGFALLPGVALLPDVEASPAASGRGLPEALLRPLPAASVTVPQRLAPAVVAAGGRGASATPVRPAEDIPGGLAALPDVLLAAYQWAALSVPDECHLDV